MVELLVELMPQDVEEEWSAEDMEAAEEEVQTIIDQYYGQTSIIRGDV